MFLKAGAVSLALLLASRLLGLARESAQAAAFGASALGDVVILMLTLPDWLAGLLVSGALSYVLVPFWAREQPPRVVAIQRRVAAPLLAGALGLSTLLIVLREPAAAWLAPGLPPSMLPAAAQSLVWSALALPAAFLAALWTTRLQHELDFTGMYAANLVVNGVLVASIACAALYLPASSAAGWLGIALVVAMLVRLGWLAWRAGPRPVGPASGTDVPASLPPLSDWAFAALAAGLPLALPFAARSMASQSGEGGLATFNYAWKLVELPLLLAVQLVATLALPPIARALATQNVDAPRGPVRAAFAMTWALACAAAAALLLGAPALASLLFGWGRMEPQALGHVAQWGAIGAWGLPAQAVIAVATAVLAAQRRMRVLVLAWSLALAALLAFAALGQGEGAKLMLLLNVLNYGVAAIVLAAMGPRVRSWVPVRPMAIAVACLGILGAIAASAPTGAWSMVAGLAAAALAAVLVMGVTWWGSADLRIALAR